MTGRRRWTLAAALAAGLSAGCSYRNAMWSAKRHANDARQLERHGEAADARSQWAQAAAKTRSWRTDEAVVLRAEGLAYSGACGDAAALIAEARSTTQDVTRRERIDLADAECALERDEPGQAEAAVAAPLVSKNDDRRSRAEYVAGRAAALHLDFQTATMHFRRSREPGAAGRALVVEQQGLITRATRRADLAPIVTELARLLRTVSGTAEAGRVLEFLTAVEGISENPAARFRAAEIARDSLHAPALAAELFLDAASDTASIYAPKALIAALALLPARHDSLAAILDSRYPTSPYTRVFHGEPSIAYAAAEDSLARDLGVQGTRNPAISGSVLFDAPVPGPRGPRLDRPQ